MVRLNSTITFQSTLSLRRATGHPIACHTLNDQISIHALLAESDWVLAEGLIYSLISIHALLAESD